MDDKITNVIDDKLIIELSSINTDIQKLCENSKNVIKSELNHAYLVLQNMLNVLPGKQDIIYYYWNNILVRLEEIVFSINNKNSIL